jgi:DNA-3-methyladenine glycosylase II
MNQISLALKTLSKDVVLKPVIKKYGKNILELSHNNDIYRDLLDSIVSQQLSTKAARTIKERVLESYGGKWPEPNALRLAKVETLRSYGVSNSKAQYILNVANYWVDNKCDNNELAKLSDVELISRLTTIKGVGQWTVEMVLMFELGRMDIFPYDDLVVRNNICLLYDIDPKDKSSRIFIDKKQIEWKPFRSVVARLMWASNDN